MPRHNYPPRKRRGDALRPSGNKALAIARELRIERGLDDPAERVPEPIHEPVAIASLMDGRGLAYVKLTPHSHRVIVSFGPHHFKCNVDGKMPGPDCEHAALIPGSDALRRAKKARAA